MQPQVTAWLMNHFDGELNAIAEILKEMSKYRGLRDEAVEKLDMELVRVYSLALGYLGEELEGKTARFGRYLVNTLESQKWEMFAPVIQSHEQA